jgi:hypothetical protein
MKPSLPVTAATVDSVWLLPTFILETLEWYPIVTAVPPGRRFPAGRGHPFVSPVATPVGRRRVAAGRVLYNRAAMPNHTTAAGRHHSRLCRRPSERAT